MQMTWVEKPGGQPLAVRLNVPVDGQAHGVLVLVPSIGRESVVSFRTMRAFAQLAADQGWAAVSFWLSGDGDSGPLPVDADPVQTWVADVEAVLAWSRRLVGDRPVHVVGLRLGPRFSPCWRQRAPVRFACSGNRCQGAHSWPGTRPSDASPFRSRRLLGALSSPA